MTQPFPILEIIISSSSSSNFLEVWNLDGLGTMRRREKKSPSIRTPREFIGRNAAIDAIQTVTRKNFMKRTSNEHAHFKFLVASGHVRSGKTRSGTETPRLVEELCSEMSTKNDHTGNRFTFTKPVYLLIDFLNGSRFNEAFDAAAWDASVSLGARLMVAFYQHEDLKSIKHDQALKHIIETVLSEADTVDSMVVPVVIHFDEHGAFVSALDDCKAETTSGRKFFEDMLKCLGSVATSYDNALSDLKGNGRFFIVPITTGTSKQDATFSQSSIYGVKPVPLPLLSVSNTRKLASAFLKANNVKEDFLNDTAFQIALCDCGSLPGLVEILCDNVEGAKKSFVQYLHDSVINVIADIPGWSSHWPSVSSIFLSRAKLIPDDFIGTDYRLSDALASGTVSYDPVEQEIQIAPVMFRIFNVKNPSFNSVLLKFVSEEVGWTWQDFKKAHLLYLAATMMALQKEKSRFTKIVLGTFLRHVQPANNIHLEYGLVLPSDVTFDGNEYKLDDHQCLVKPWKRRRHGVETACDKFARLAALGNPFVDGYMNLILQTETSGADLHTTLFVQYKHSTALCPSCCKVSEMNEEIKELDNALRTMKWATNRHWLLLWVTNNPIHVDDEPHERLLWVGKDELEKHAPLIGRRGLVIME
jgi:hypothetical protein